MTDSMNNFENPKRTLVGEQLDAALAKYAAVEPRAGLEERILANLRGHVQPAAGIAWWRWAGALVAAVLLGILLLWRVETHKPQPIVRRPAKSQEEVSPRAVAKSVPTSISRPVSRVVARTFQNHVLTAAVEPKLDRFPSPQPLSEEELALVRYVQSFPKEATLIAQAQEEFALETQRVMDDAGSQNRPSGSIPSER